MRMRGTSGVGIGSCESEMNHGRSGVVALASALILRDDLNSRSWDPSEKPCFESWPAAR